MKILLVKTFWCDIVGANNEERETNMKDEAIANALKWTEGKSFSDGNICLGTSPDHVAVAWNQTTHNQNQILVLTQRDAATLYSLLHSAGMAQGWIHSGRMGGNL